MPDAPGGLRGWLSRYLNTSPRDNLEEVRRDIRLATDEITRLRDTVSMLTMRVDRDLGSTLSNAVIALQRSVDQHETLSALTIRQGEQEGRFEKISDGVAEVQKKLEANAAELQTFHLALKTLGKNLESAGEHTEKIANALFERLRLLEISDKLKGQKPG